jgi:hypothetical protein
MFYNNHNYYNYKLCIIILQKYLFFYAHSSMIFLIIITVYFSFINFFLFQNNKTDVLVHTSSMINYIVNGSMLWMFEKFGLMETNVN